jgi:hypothetical protein
MKAALSLVLICGLIAMVAADNITRNDFKEIVVGVPKHRGVVAEFLKNIGPVLQSTTRCPDGGTCQEGTTCCPRTNGVYGCCLAAPALCCPMGTCCAAAGNACCPTGGCCAIGSTCCSDGCCPNQGVCCANGCCDKERICCRVNGVTGCCSGGSSTTICSFLQAWCLLLGLSTVYFLV